MGQTGLDLLVVEDIDEKPGHIERSTDLLIIDKAARKMREVLI